MNRYKRFFTSAWVTLVFAAASAWAQSQTAVMTGVVTDPTAAAVPGTKITVTNQDTGIRQNASSDAEGRYTFPAVIPGIYEIRVETQGFKSFVRRNITLEVNQVGRVDVALEVGNVTESVEVNAQALLLNTETSSRGQAVSTEEIADLPLENRDWFDLAYLVPGVTPGADGLGGGGSYANVNGSRHDAMNFIVDGATNKNMRFGVPQTSQAVDTIQEFRVETSNYSAQYGRMSSAVMSAVIKSGTNQFHGLLTHFHRNAFFDARNFFDQDKSKLIRNQFGGTFSGPVRRDRLFFFMSYDGRRERNGGPASVTVPTVAQRAGDFSGSRAALMDPLSERTPFPGNRIPASRFHPISMNVLKYWPLPGNIPLRGTDNLYNNQPAGNSGGNYLGKVDYQIRPRHSLSVRHTYNRGHSETPYRATAVPGFETESDTPRHNGSITYTANFRPNLVNQLIFGFSRADSKIMPVHRDIDYSEVLGITGITREKSLLGFPQVRVRNMANIGDIQQSRIIWTATDFQLNNVTRWIRGGHNVSFGVEIVKSRVYELVAANSLGTFQFQGRLTTTSTNSNLQEPFADFLLGLLQSANRRLNPIRDYTHADSYAVFFQDDWKVSRSLTINLGLRYELFMPPYDKHDRWSNFVPEAGRPVVSGEAGYPRALVYTDKNNFGPRLGLAWLPFGNQKTVLRTGYGLQYGGNLVGPTAPALGTSAPFTIVENYNTDVNNPAVLTWSNPFPQDRGSVAGITSPSGFELRPALGYMQNFHFTIERELANRTVAEAAYVGSKGTHLGHQWDLNQPIRRAEFAPRFPRPYPGYSTINYFTFDSNSNYNSLQTSVRMQRSFLNARVSYVFSKSIDEGSALTGNSSGGAGALQDVRNRRSERARSDFDRTHSVVTSALWRLPSPKNSGRLLTGMLGGWQLNNMFKAYSGTPLTVRVGNVNLDMGEASRPDRIGSGKVENPGPNGWFNPKDFVPVVPGSYRLGNSGRNILTGPGLVQFDCSLQKVFQIVEKHRLQFRWDVYNVVNLVNFGTPNMSVDNLNAGMITSARPARQMQVALKYTF